MMAIATGFRSVPDAKMDECNWLVSYIDYTLVVLR